MKKEEKLKTREQFIKNYEKEDFWINASENTKQKILDYMIDIIADERDEFDELKKEKENWSNQGVLFLGGIFVGITGGLVSNIIHSVLERFGIYYFVPAIIAFIFVCWVIIFFIRSVNPLSKNKNYIAIVNEARKRKEEMNKRQM